MTTKSWIAHDNIHLIYLGLARRTPTPPARSVTFQCRSQYQNIGGEKSRAVIMFGCHERQENDHVGVEACVLIGTGSYLMPSAAGWQAGRGELSRLAAGRRGGGAAYLQPVVERPALSGLRRPNHGGRGPSASGGGPRTRLTDASATGAREGSGA